MHAAAPSGKLMSDPERLCSEDHQHGPSDSPAEGIYSSNLSWEWERTFRRVDAKINTYVIYGLCYKIQRGS